MANNVDKSGKGLVAFEWRYHVLCQETVVERCLAPVFPCVLHMHLPRVQEWSNVVLKLKCNRRLCATLMTNMRNSH